MKKVHFDNYVQVIYYNKHEPIINFKNNNNNNNKKIKLVLILIFIFLLILYFNL